ncbi:MAG TPA: hypothetical protein PKO45_01700 [Rubrivivax sp.]|nr:hypothetical protein [Burkholderiales bacterium]HNT37809.1 hypothetical protein [Rubrivivax sp.]
MSLFDVMMNAGTKVPTTEAERDELVITEVSTGYWTYHLSRRRNIMRGLCGAPTLPTAMPLSAWGAPGDESLPKHKHPAYCEKCARIAWPEGKPDTPG